MYELYPYFTNDGSVGLFSPVDDDIYHSTYGALSESWEKFIIPSRLEEYLSSHNEVKILDICYGIGYNTKTALEVFIKNYFRHKKNKLRNKKSKNHLPTHSSIAAIDTDNTQGRRKENFCKKYEIFFAKFSLSSTRQPQNNAAIDTDNIKNDKIVENCCYINEKYKNTTQKNCNKILIDAVDMDNLLIDISPFIAEAPKFNFNSKKEKDCNNSLSKNNIKYQQINSMQKTVKKIKRIRKNPKNDSFLRFFKSDLGSARTHTTGCGIAGGMGASRTREIARKIPNFSAISNKKFKLKKETSMIIMQKLFEQDCEFFNDPILQQILAQKKYSPFFSKSMLNFARFYQNQGSYNTKNALESTFLHNI